MRKESEIGQNENDANFNQSLHDEVVKYYEEIVQSQTTETAEENEDTDSLPVFSEKISSIEYAQQFSYYISDCSHKIHSLILMHDMYTQYMNGFLVGEGIDKRKNKPTILMIQDKLSAISETLNSMSAFTTPAKTPEEKVSYFHGEPKTTEDQPEVIMYHGQDIDEMLQKRKEPVFSYHEMMSDVYTSYYEIDSLIDDLDAPQTKKDKLSSKIHHFNLLLSGDIGTYAVESSTQHQFIKYIAYYDKDIHEAVYTEQEKIHIDFLNSFDDRQERKDYALVNTLRQEYVLSIADHPDILPSIEDTQNTETYIFSDKKFSIDFSIDNTAYTGEAVFSVQESNHNEDQKEIFMSLTIDGNEYTFVRLEHESGDITRVYIGGHVLSQADADVADRESQQLPPRWTTENKGHIFSTLTITDQTSNKQLSTKDELITEVENDEAVQSFEQPNFPIGQMVYLFFDDLLSGELSIAGKTLMEYMMDGTYFDLINGRLSPSNKGEALTNEIIDYTNVYLKQIDPKSLVNPARLRHLLSFNISQRLKEIFGYSFGFNNQIRPYIQACDEIDKQKDEFSTHFRHAAIGSELYLLINAYKQKNPIGSLPSDVENIFSPQGNNDSLIDTLIYTISSGEQVTNPGWMDDALRKQILEKVPLRRAGKKDDYTPLVKEEDIDMGVSVAKAGIMQQCTMHLARATMSGVFDAYANQVVGHQEWKLDVDIPQQPAEGSLADRYPEILGYAKIEGVGGYRGDAANQMASDVTSYAIDIGLIFAAGGLARLGMRGLMMLGSRAFSVASTGSKALSVSQRIYQMYKYGHGLKLFGHGFKNLSRGEKLGRIGLFSTEMAVEGTLFHTFRSGMDVAMGEAEREEFQEEIVSAEKNLHSIAMIGILKVFGQGTNELMTKILSSQSEAAAMKTLQQLLEQPIGRLGFQTIQFGGEILAMRGVDNAINITFGKGTQALSGQYALEMAKVILGLRMSHAFTNKYRQQLQQKKQNKTAQAVEEALMTGKKLNFTVERDFNGDTNIFVAVEGVPGRLLYAQKYSGELIEFSEDVSKGEAYLENALNIGTADLSYVQTKTLIETGTVDVKRTIGGHTTTETYNLKSFDKKGQEIETPYEQKQLSDYEMDCIRASHMWNPSGRMVGNYLGVELQIKLDIAQGKYQLEGTGHNARVKTKDGLPQPVKGFEFAPSGKGHLIRNGKEGTEPSLLGRDVALQLIKNGVCSGILKAKLVVFAKKLLTMAEQTEGEGRQGFRPLQRKALNAIIAHIANGFNRGYVSMPTGVGKSYLYAKIIEVAGSKTMLTCPANLMQQTKDKLLEVAGETIKEEDIIMLSPNPKEGETIEKLIEKYAERIAAGEFKVIIASPRTLLEMQKNRPGDLSEIAAKIELLIEDEAHTALGEKSLEAIEQVLKNEAISQDMFLDLCIDLTEVVKLYSKSIRDYEEAIDEIEGLISDELDVTGVTPESTQKLNTIIEKYGITEIITTPDKAGPQTWDQLKESFAEKTGVKKIQLLFTATPNLIQKGLSTYYPEIIKITLEEAFQDGTLIKPTRMSDDHTVIINEKNGEETETSIDAFLSKKATKFMDDSGNYIYETLTGDFLAQKEKSDKKIGSFTYMPTIGFCGSIAHARVVGEHRQSNGLRPVIVSSKPDESRRDSFPEENRPKEVGLLEQARKYVASGMADGMLVINMNAGFDFPPLFAGIRYYPTLSEANSIQSIGRVFRSVNLRQGEEYIDYLLFGFDGIPGKYKQFCGEIVDGTLSNPVIESYKTQLQANNLTFSDVFFKEGITIPSPNGPGTTTKEALIKHLLYNELHDAVGYKVSDNSYWFEPRWVGYQYKATGKGKQLTLIPTDKNGGQPVGDLVSIKDSFDFMAEESQTREAEVLPTYDEISNLDNATIYSYLLNKVGGNLEDVLGLTTQERRSIGVSFEGQSYLLSAITSQVFENSGKARPERFNPIGKQADWYTLIGVLRGKEITIKEIMMEHFEKQFSRTYSTFTGAPQNVSSIKNLKIAGKTMKDIYELFMGKPPKGTSINKKERFDLHEQINQQLTFRKLNKSQNKEMETTENKDLIIVNFGIYKLTPKNTIIVLRQNYLTDKEKSIQGNTAKNDILFKKLRGFSATQRQRMGFKSNDSTGKEERMYLNALATYLGITKPGRYNPVNVNKDWFHFLDVLFEKETPDRNDSDIKINFKQKLIDKGLTKQQAKNIRKEERNSLFVDNEGYVHSITDIIRATYGGTEQTPYRPHIATNEKRHAFIDKLWESE